MKLTKISLCVLLVGASLVYSADNSQTITTAITQAVIKTRVWRCVCYSGCFNRVCQRWFGSAPEPEIAPEPSRLFTRAENSRAAELRKRGSSNENKVRLSQRLSSPTTTITDSGLPVPPLDLNRIKIKHDPLSELTDVQIPGEVA